MKQRTVIRFTISQDCGDEMDVIASGKLSLVNGTLQVDHFAGQGSADSPIWDAIVALSRQVDRIHAEMGLEA